MLRSRYRQEDPTRATAPIKPLDADAAKPSQTTSQITSRLDSRMRVENDRGFRFGLLRQRLGVDRQNLSQPHRMNEVVGSRLPVSGWINTVKTTPIHHEPGHKSRELSDRKGRPDTSIAYAVRPICRASVRSEPRTFRRSVRAGSPRRGACCRTVEIDVGVVAVDRVDWLNSHGGVLVSNAGPRCKYMRLARARIKEWNSLARSQDRLDLLCRPEQCSILSAAGDDL